MPLRNFPDKQFPLNNDRNIRTMNKLNNNCLDNSQLKLPNSNHNNLRNYDNNEDEDIKKKKLPKECKVYRPNPKKGFKYVDSSGYKKCLKTCKSTNTTKSKCIDKGKKVSDCTNNMDCMKQNCIYYHCSNKSNRLN